MNLSKKILIAALVSIGALFTACQNPAQDSPKPKIAALKAYNESMNQIDFSSGDIAVDPNELKLITITFDKEMNTRYSDWVYYGDILDQIGSYGYGWANSKTYFIYFNLSYSSNIKIVFNDMDFYKDHKDFGLWRDTDGNIMSEYALEFSTKPNPRTTPKVFEIDTKEIFAKDYPINLQFNEYGENNEDLSGSATGNMQAGISIKSLFYPETILKNDTITFTYKIKASAELPSIIVNLIDDSKAANYWGNLSSVTDLSLNQNKTYNADDEMYYYEGEMTFPVTAAKIYNCTLKFTCKDKAALSKTKNITFFVCKKE